KIGQKTRALYYANSIDKLPIQAILDVTNRLIVYNSLKDLYETNGKYQKALHYHELRSHLRDSLYTAENKEKLFELETKYETERKEQEISSLKQAAEIQSLALTKKNNQIIIGGLLAFVLAGAAFVYNRQRKIKQAKASLELEQRFLRSQLNPHFIFNSMKTIQQYLLTESSEKASDYMSVFSKLMRQILENSREEFITLEEEVSMLNNYLELQKLRFQNNFEYTIEIDESLDIAYNGIPPMFAQPFIENALEHGLFKKNENTIAIRLFKVSDELIRLEIMDTGIGVTEQLTSTDHKSLATKITNERLEKMRVSYKGEFSVTTENVENASGEIQGYKVSLSLPSKLVAA
ncbi:MAG: histidine kinase, partial [Bacteroidota bacterium]